MKKLFLIITALISTVAVAQLQRINLSVENSYSTSWTATDASNLIDDNPNTTYLPTGWNQSILKPFRLLFAFDDYSTCIVKRLTCYVPNNGSFEVRFYVRKKDTGEEVLIYTLTQGQWPPGEKIIDIPQNLWFDASRLIVEHSTGGNVFPNYLQVWGSYAANAPPVATHTRKPIKSLMGVVMHSGSIGFTPSAGNRAIPKFKDAILGLGATYLRVYVEAGRVRDINGKYHFNDWGLQANLPALKALGIYTRVCWEGQSADINNTYPKDEDAGGNRLFKTTADIPFQLNNRVDKLKPETYLEYGKNLYNLTLNEDAPDVEGHNENDKTWWGEFGNQSYEELAVMASVGYDGHERRFPGVGVKQANPNTKFTIGGYAFDRPDPLWVLRDWFLKYRTDKKIPGETISLHSYNSLEYLNSGSGDIGGLPPEVAQIPKLKLVARWRDRYAPDLNIDIGEYGWDIAHGSPLYAAAYGRYTSEQTRANWVVRFILLLNELGIDYAQYYQFMMDGMWMKDNPFVFGTMEFIRQLTDLKEITSDVYDVQLCRVLTGDYFRQISLGLGDYTFQERISSDPIVLRFSNGVKDVYVIWKPESWTKQPVGNVYEPVFTENTGTYVLQKPGRLMELAEDSSGAFKMGGIVTSVSYGSKPVFIMVDHVSQSPLPVKLISFTAEKQGSTALLQWQVDGAKKFEVERSADGTHFTAIAKLSSFSVYDLWPLQGFNFYRLKMIEDDGSFSYSPIARVQFSLVQLTAKVLDVTGRKIKEVIVNDTNRFEEQLKHDRSLPAGVYIIQYSDNKKLFFNNKIQKLP